ncbi:hypothetical protein M427DRAFT_50695 [Gonapodya prolifera JEL478]|uniref:FERM domain-containing protein n=1 Tax=Gonapodya prolifera (strain JEL478) TaxID=1344416 RepID=A0A139B0Y8_GONPJ|nr:hypothetical protein M427DRAFT_50695 [Gonapodya prolifera JEL478]|eukprot:KXS22365.1 hypothetical protein M427DRAFT_50695 [Gonapodya prolifera JEL478]
MPRVGSIPTNVHQQLSTSESPTSGARDGANEIPPIFRHFNSQLNRCDCIVVRVRIYAGDVVKEQTLKFSDDEMLLVQDVHKAVADKEGLSETSRKMFAMWMVGSQVELQLRPYIDLFEMLSLWPRWVEKYTHHPNVTPASSPFSAPCKFHLSFRRECLVPKAKERKVAEEAAVRLLFGEARRNVLAGRYPCAVEDACVLAGVQMQLRHGDFDPRKHGDGFLSDQLEEFVPRSLIERLKPSDWEARIYDNHRKYKGRSPIICRMLYLQFVRQWPFYGSAFFPCCRTVPPGGFFEYRKENWLCAVNAEGISIVDVAKNKLVLHKDYSQLTWEWSPDTLVLSFPASTTPTPIRRPSSPTSLSPSPHDVAPGGFSHSTLLRFTLITPQAYLANNVGSRAVDEAVRREEDLEKVRRDQAAAVGQAVSSPESQGLAAGHPNQSHRSRAPTMGGLGPASVRGARPDGVWGQ